MNYVKYICCLCLGQCNDYKLIQNECGESNVAYDVTVKYFDPMIFTDEQNENSLGSSTRVLCKMCWSHIDNFHEFQISVLQSRTLLHELKSQKINMYEAQDMMFTSAERDPSDESLLDEKQIEFDAGLNEDIPLENLIRHTRMQTRSKTKSFPEISILGCNKITSSNDSIIATGSSLKVEESNSSNIAELVTVKIEEGNAKCIPCNPSSRNMRAEEKKDKSTLPAQSKVKTKHLSSTDIKESKIYLKPVQNAKSTKVKNKDVKRSSEELKDKRREDDLFIAQWKPILDCDLCATTVSNFDEMRDHFRITHNTRYYIKCCERKFYRRYALIAHIRLHVNPETYKCDVCGKLSTTKHNLKLHKKIVHSQSREFECEVCHRLFNQKPNLDRHLLIHVEGEKKYFCEECGRGYVLEIQLKSHMKSVHEVNHICDQCGKIFHGQGALKIHFMEHAGVKRRKFPCDICGIEIVSKIGLKRHKAAFHHDGSTAYVCGICGKVTSSENALRHHKKYVHEKNKKYKCTYCDKAFMRPKGLREHVASHTGVDLYQCSHCPQTFKVSANMHHHRKRAHPVEWEEARRNKLILPKVNIEQCTNQVVL